MGLPAGPGRPSSPTGSAPGTWIAPICCSPPATAPPSRGSPSAPASSYHVLVDVKANAFGRLRSALTPTPGAVPEQRAGYPPTRRCIYSGLHGSGDCRPHHRGLRHHFDVRVHDLRHAHASWLLAGGSDLKSVMDRRGHAQITTT